MSTIVVLGILAFGCLLIGMIGYSTMTDKVIKDQEREISRLRRDNKRLEAALAGRQITVVRNDNKDPFKAW